MSQATNQRNNVHPSTPPFDYCEFCLTRKNVFYDPSRLRHLCFDCKVYLSLHPAEDPYRRKRPEAV